MNSIRFANSFVATFVALTVGACATDDTDSSRDEAFSRDASAATADDTVDPAQARCSNSEPIAALLCQLSASSGTGRGQGGLADLSGLLDALGGLGNIASVLAPVLGTTTTTQSPASGFVDLVNLAGGLGNIAQLMSQLQSGQTFLTTLFNGQAQTMAPPDLADVLAQFGVPVAGPPVTLPQLPTALDCSAPTLPVLQFACALLPPAQ